MLIEIYQQQWQVKTKLYPGIAELLHGLENRSIQMAILSNKIHRSTKLIVGEILSKWQFRMVFGAREDIPLKPNPQTALEIAKVLSIKPADILFVGDSGIDMETGQNAGMTSVGVLWGLRDGDELREYGGKHFISSPSELLKILGS